MNVSSVRADRGPHEQDGAAVNVVHGLTTVPPWFVVALVALLPALEASALVGLVIPGETAVLAGGVAAHAGIVPLWVVVLAAICGAAAGDQVGYLLGRRYGPALLRRLPVRMRGERNVEIALSLIRRRGALAVVLGRWAATLRALVPGLAGLSGMGRTRFTIANVTGGAVWASVIAVAGSLAGASYAAVERRLGVGSVVLLVAVVALLAVWVVRARRRRETGTEDCRDGTVSRA
jgi:membrane-associated protein